MAASIIAGVRARRRYDPNATMHASQMFDAMPTAEEAVLQGVIMKRPDDPDNTSWRRLFGSVTNSNFFFAKDAQDEVCLFRIPLHEVTTVATNDIRSTSSASEQSGPLRRESSGRSLNITTIPDGYNKGRTFEFRVGLDSYARWIDTLQRLVDAACAAHAERMKLTPLQRLEQQSKALHDAGWFQTLFGAVIMTSFMASICQAEMIPAKDSTAFTVFQITDYVLTSLFTIELLVTCLAHMGFVFFQDGWRIFDSLVVALSLVSVSGIEIPSVKALRALRVLRALRLLKKSKLLRPMVYTRTRAHTQHKLLRPVIWSTYTFPSVWFRPHPCMHSRTSARTFPRSFHSRTPGCTHVPEHARTHTRSHMHTQIRQVVALFSSAVPVLNALVLLALITAIYATMAVGLFGEENDVMFGTFSRAIFTMFQATTIDSWGSILARATLWQGWTDQIQDGSPEPAGWAFIRGQGSTAFRGSPALVPAFFFASYMLIASLVSASMLASMLACLPCASAGEYHMPTLTSRLRPPSDTAAHRGCFAQVLVNVVIGVLLERFLMTMTLSRVQVEQEEARSSLAIREGPLDKIIEVSSCVPVAHLSSHIVTPTDFLRSWRNTETPTTLSTRSSASTRRWTRTVQLFVRVCKCGDLRVRVRACLH